MNGGGATGTNGTRERGGAENYEEWAGGGREGERVADAGEGERERGGEGEEERERYGGRGGGKGEDSQ
eukprot:1492494-Rhodomonas_salina.1